MAEIISYPVNTTVLETDLLLGTHIPQPNGSKPTSTKNFTVGSIVNLVNSRPYKVYTALLTRTGDTAPTATILENTIGTITFSYTMVGNYSVNSVGLFTAGKTTVFIQQDPNGSFGNVLAAANTTTNQIAITQSTFIGTNDDDWTFPVSIEIRVYN